MMLKLESAFRYTLPLAIGLLQFSSAQAQQGSPNAQEAAGISLVRVNITTETRGDGETVVLDGRRIPNYHPKIIEMFPSTGIVLDASRHVLIFLGYRWADIQGRNHRIEIIAGQGQKLAGKLIGIDQSTGVAVVEAQEGSLPGTALCLRCEIRDGATVVTPVLEDQGISQFESAKIVSVTANGNESQSGWEVTINRRLPGIGEPLLDVEHRVLGFIASQKPSPQDPMGVHTVVFPMSQLLTSAEKIIQAKGDIRTGWLGVYLDDLPPSSPGGVRIRSILEASPAEKAGLLPEDVLVKWNGTPIRDALQFIRLVQGTHAGTGVELEVIRAGNAMTIPAVVENRKPEENHGTIIFKFPDEISLPNSRVEGEITYLKSPGRPVQQDHPRIGIQIVALTPQLADYLQVPGQAGLLVSAVEDKMPAATAGVQVGDVIVSVDGQRFLDPGDFSSYVHSRSWGSKILLKVLRKGVERSTALFLKQPLLGQHRKP